MFVPYHSVACAHEFHICVRSRESRVHILACIYEYLHMIRKMARMSLSLICCEWYCTCISVLIYDCITGITIYVVHVFILIILYALFFSTYMAFDTLIEPHQLTATLQCVAAVSRSLLSGGYGRYIIVF